MNTNTVIILAAGNSTRMGTPKALLSFSEAENFLEHLVAKYLEFRFEKIVVVLNPVLLSQIQPSGFARNKNVLLVENKHPEKSRNYSLHLGLTHAGVKQVFIQNIDNPLVSYELLHGMDQALGEHDYVYPVYNNRGGHPILVSEKLAKKIKKNDNLDMPLNRFLTNFNGFRFTTTNPEVLININTINDYHAFIKNHK